LIELKYGTSRPISSSLFAQILQQYLSNLVTSQSF